MADSSSQFCVEWVFLVGTARPKTHYLLITGCPWRLGDFRAVLRFPSLTLDFERIFVYNREEAHNPQRIQAL